MRLIDADATIADLLTVDPQYETMIDWCCRVLEAQPAVDAEPVIRCKDCKHRYNGKDDSPCELLNMPLGLSEDFYCMFAEPKDKKNETKS